MANSFQTGSAEMMQAVQQMQEVNEALQGNLRTLQSEVEGISGQWVGTAATAFANLMDKFNTDATKLNTDLQQISEAVAGNQKAYQASEDESHSSMTTILGGLG
ncbi:MAG TPA: WXG100 family type VII secretion target [Pseudonocardiaceae bacterium]|jgi:WXG100 family type VII secretion target|nr:WXG100 family type VII secretion target [Pseudonocardiaceae bacterium]